MKLFCITPCQGGLNQEIIFTTCAQRLFLTAINEQAQFNSESAQLGSVHGNTTTMSQRTDAHRR
jgi:hypothetical protein